MSLFRTKPIDPNANTGLKRTLTALDLTLLGIGCIIGTGIFVLTGVAAAEHAGPAIVLSFIISGTACAFAAFCYAELASAVGGAGSAYGYAYVGIGELVAWIIGWSLILEYSLVVSAVAVGWSGYAAPLLEAWAGVPMALMQGPEEHYPMCEEVARTVHISRQLGEPKPIDERLIASLYDRYQNVYGQ